MTQRSSCSLCVELLISRGESGIVLGTSTAPQPAAPGWCADLEARSGSPIPLHSALPSSGRGMTGASVVTGQVDTMCQVLLVGCLSVASMYSFGI